MNRQNRPLVANRDRSHSDRLGVWLTTSFGLALFAVGWITIGVGG